MGYYKTWASLGVLLGLNIAARLLNLPVSSNLLLGNHLVESATALTITTFLVDLGIIDGKIEKNIFYVGLIALFGGIIMVTASFSSLFIFPHFWEIASSWMRIAPFVIFLIGIPSLYIGQYFSRKSKVFGFKNLGMQGLINVFIATALYSILALYLLIKFGWIPI